MDKARTAFMTMWIETSVDSRGSEGKCKNAARLIKRNGTGLLQIDGLEVRVLVPKWSSSGSPRREARGPALSIDRLRTLSEVERPRRATKRDSEITSELVIRP